MPSYNIPAIEALTKALQDATRSEQPAQAFGCTQEGKSVKGSGSRHYKPVEKAVERFISENRAYGKKARNVIVGSY